MRTTRSMNETLIPKDNASPAARPGEIDAARIE
jgi:hypothetical protein